MYTQQEKFYNFGNKLRDYTRQLKKNDWTDINACRIACVTKEIFKTCDMTICHRTLFQWKGERSKQVAGQGDVNDQQTEEDGNTIEFIDNDAEEEDEVSSLRFDVACGFKICNY